MLHMAIASSGFALTFVVTFAADANLHRASAQWPTAQCPSGSQIFIDPRLAPRRPWYSAAQLQQILASEDIPPQRKKQALDLYTAQSQPIEMPFGAGRVLIHPQNPCIQQYIGP
jgi:hypothetical protein